MGIPEEAEQEIETLGYIYPTEMEVLGPNRIQIAITEGEVVAGLMVQFTEEYPDAVPGLNLVGVSGLETDELAALEAHIQEVAESSRGMQMVFTLVSSAQEFIQNTLAEREKRIEREKLEKQRLEEEAERLRFLGTKVTVETFTTWNAKFMAELAAAIPESVRLAEKERGKKLTGRQLFEKDTSLVRSDLGLIEDGDVAVDVDLFDTPDMEGLDLSDDDDDDEENQVIAGFDSEDD